MDADDIKALINILDQRLENVALRELRSTSDTLSEESTFLQVEDGSCSLSENAVNAYIRLMAKIFNNRLEGDNIYVNCYCRGWMKTSMTGYFGNISAVRKGLTRD